MDKENTNQVIDEVNDEAVTVETTETETAQEETTAEEVQEEKKEEKVEKSVEEILKEKEKEWQAETDRRVNQALAKKEAELTDKIQKQLEEKLRAVEIREVQAEINSVIKTAGLSEDNVKFIKAENYLGENKEKLAEDLESLKVLLASTQKQPIYSTPGTGRTYDLFEEAKRKGDVDAMLDAKFGK